ncbi:hypothetical protein H6P81_010930 [Aristolochia fimbriata]|uniref:Uncharacterized protein n=1 Tax=Aristolochia fimbriata TaxID=158543 RepID=A0AAV7EQ56_ARIFI|nr:hypothetical protein H6P81_010930 [Aristolochia fimbriata]
MARFAGVILVHSGRRLCWGFSRAETVSAPPSPTTSPVAPANREALRLNGEQGSAMATARPARAIPTTSSGSFSPGTGFAVKNLQKKRELGRTLERATLGRSRLPHRVVITKGKAWSNETLSRRGGVWGSAGSTRRGGVPNHETAHGSPCTVQMGRPAHFGSPRTIRMVDPVDPDSPEGPTPGLF